MNKPVVTKTVLTRTVQALEAAGKTVGAVEIRPDGSVRVLLDGADLAPEDTDERDLREFRREHGYG